MTRALKSYPKPQASKGAVRTFVSLGSLVLLLCGCSAVSVGVIDLTPRQPFTGDLIVYHPDQTLPNLTYREIAVFTYECGADDAAKQIEEMVVKARQLGANALILRNPAGMTLRHPGSDPNWCNASAVVFE